MKVLVAGEHAVVRRAVCRALAGTACTEFAECDSARAAIEQAARDRPDICIIDSAVPGGALDAIRAIDRMHAPVVVLADEVDEDAVLQAVRAGAVGYLAKDIAPERLRAAIEGTLDGEAALPRRLVRSLTREVRELDRAERVSTAVADGFTRRERQVLQLLRREVTTAEMAVDLDVSPVTVRRHVSELLRKLGATDRADALRLLQTLDV